MGKIGVDRRNGLCNQLLRGSLKECVTKTIDWMNQLYHRVRFDCRPTALPSGFLCLL